MLADRRVQPWGHSSWPQAVTFSLGVLHSGVRRQNLNNQANSNNCYHKAVTNFKERRNSVGIESHGRELRPSYSRAGQWAGRTFLEMTFELKPQRGEYEPGRPEEGQARRWEHPVYVTSGRSTLGTAGECSLSTHEFSEQEEGGGGQAGRPGSHWKDLGLFAV